MKKKQFLEQFSKQALDERISLFLGAGGSCDAGYPTWSSLFEPLARELNTTIDSTTDYYLLAQYYANTFGRRELRKKINNYINDLKKKFQIRDKKIYEDSCIKNNRPIDFKNMPTSKEVYLLNNFKWLILQNVENIDYQSNVRYNHKLKAYLNTYDYEKMFFQLDDNLVQIRRLKEKYIEFNKTEERDPEKINTLLSNIIDCYSHSTLIMFKEFSELLKAHKQEIINSFIYITDNNGNERRLSNGPMEGYNRTPKDFKRNSRGLSNFEYVRSRLIWANRKNESILAIFKFLKEVFLF